MMETIVDCICCGNPATVHWIEGEEEIRYPNDRAYPGSPPEIDLIEGCQCYDYLSPAKGDVYLEDMLREAMEREEEDQMAALDAKNEREMEERYLERRERETI